MPAYPDPITGWGNYPDSQYTSGSPFSLSADTDTLVPNDSAGSLLNETQMPPDLDAFFVPGVLNFDAQTVAFTKGQTVTGGTSGATATIVSVISDGSAGSLYVRAISGTFQNDEAITDGSGGSATADGALGPGILTGKNGDAYNLTLDLKVVPTSAAATQIEFWVDIGGAVGELYRRILTFPKGTGQIRPVVLTTGVYTLDTWEQNGGQVFMRSNGPCDVYDIRFVIFRIHKAV